MKARSLITTFILFLLLAGSAVGAYARNVLTVTKVDDTSDGVCDSDCSLREAVAAAASGDTIVFSEHFNTPQTITLVNGQIEITQNVTIAGPGSGLLSISGNDTGRIFLVFIGSRVVFLSGIHLRSARNNFDGNGGAIYFRDGALTISDIVFSGNYARFVTTSGTFGAGSAIFALNSNVVITDSSFYDNSAVSGTVDGLSGSTINITNSSISHNQGGGVSGITVHAIDCNFNGNSGHAVGANHLTLLNSRVTNNNNGGAAAGISMVIDRSVIAFNTRFNSRNQSGGGIVNLGHAVITNSTIANNRVNGNGGGIRNGGTMYISNSSIVNNEGGSSAFDDASGGGIYNSSGDLYLTNTTVSGNRSVWGAGIFNRGAGGARISLTNSTVAFNRSGIGPGGIVNEPGGIATLRNSIVNKNTRNQDLYDISGVIASQGFNMIGPQNDSGPWLPSDMVGVINPFLAPLGSNGSATLTHALYPKSPAINAGSNPLAVDPETKLALSTDQRGWARVAGDVVDIGAYEANYSPLPVSLAGRLVTTKGRGIAGARVSLSGEAGDIRYAITNPFGYYRFVNLPAGGTYTITGSDKLYNFASPITLTTDQNRDDLIFHGVF